MSFLDSGRVRTRIDDSLITRDGVRLSADVYLPPDPGGYPALVTMTPYDNNRTPRVHGNAPPMPAKADIYRALADIGYIVVSVDMRGRGDSDGEFVPFVHEAQDSVDAIAWTRGLAECDGRVGAFGSGYSGFAALAAAVGGAPDAVFAVSPFGPGAGGLIAPGGAVRLEWLFWMHLIAGRTVQPPDLPCWPDVFTHLPLASMAEALGRDNIWWSEWVGHADPSDSFWDPMRHVQENAGSISVPLLLLTGRWDTGQPATLAYWSEKADSTAGPRELVVGPWDTAGTRSPARTTGGVDFGNDAVVDSVDLVLDWFDRALGTSAWTEGHSRARVFVTGSNRWAELDAWPPYTGLREFHLTSSGRANTRAGDGRLAVEQPGAEQRADVFMYDPTRPVLWQPGMRSFSRHPNQQFTLDESHITSRDDVLVFTSEPADVPWTIAGQCRLVLYAETDAPDTDWIVTLSDVFPGGSGTVQLTHAAVRARMNPELEAGSVIEYQMGLPDVAHEFQTGHSLRLTVTSSMFPLYARNPNHADYAHGAEVRVACQHIHHDEQRPSRLCVPVAQHQLAPARASRTGWFSGGRP